jgi:hypothetical protein
MVLGDKNHVIIASSTCEEATVKGLKSLLKKCMRANIALRRKYESGNHPKV